MKRTHIILLLIIAVSIGIIMSLVADSSSYETFASANTKREVHVVGFLNKEKDLFYNPEVNPDFFSFYMLDKDGKEKKVVFKGAKPQDFERSEQIVLTGKMMNDEFIASKILMKCPSKYVNDELEVVEVQSS